MYEMLKRNKAPAWRAFSRFPQPERERMLELAKVGEVETARLAVADFDRERAGVVAPGVRRLLGIGPHSQVR